MTDGGTHWSDVALVLPFALAVGLGFLMRRHRGAAALAGLPIALALWAVVALSGGFDDDTEGTAAALGLVYGVPSYALLWAGAFGAGYAAQRVLRRDGPRESAHE